MRVVLLPPYLLFFLSSLFLFFPLFTSWTGHLGLQNILIVYCFTSLYLKYCSKKQCRLHSLVEVSCMPDVFFCCCCFASFFWLVGLLDCFVLAFVLLEAIGLGPVSRKHR